MSRNTIAFATLLIIVCVLASIQLLVMGSMSDPTDGSEQHTQSPVVPTKVTSAMATEDPRPLGPLRTPTPPTPTSEPATATPVSTSTQTPTPTATKTPTVTPTATPAPPSLTGAGVFPTVSARAVVVVDERSGQVLYDQDAHLRVAPASCTKIVTAIVALEHGDLEDVVKVEFDPDEMYRTESSVMGLHVGDEVTLQDLLYGLMLPSGNDAAVAIANHIAGSVESFASLMNQKAEELGLENSSFKNPHGLDEEGHYSSAYDMVMFARYAMLEHSLFVKLSAARLWSVRGSRSYDIYSVNSLLQEYEGADGVKTGYTDAAGRTIVASATRDGHRVYIGLMRSNDLWADCRLLFDYVFANYSRSHD